MPALPRLGSETPGRPPFRAKAYLIRKSSRLALFPLVAAAIQRGIRPRPVQVSAEFLGLRYLGATLPPLPPRPRPNRSWISNPACLATAVSFSLIEARSWLCFSALRLASLVSSS